MTFAHLSVHSKASMLYGSADIKELVARAKELGQPAVALTDYTNVFAAINFYSEATKAGVKPILGADVLFCEDAEQLKVHKVRQVSHLVLLAESEEGWKNITRILSKAGSEDYFFYNPRVDFKLLEQHKEGVICLTGGTLDGVIASHLYDRVDESGEVIESAAIFKAEGLVRRFLKIFDKDHFFLEVQDHGLPAEQQANARLRNIAVKYSLRTVATNNVHYVAPHDAEAHKTLLAMNANQYSKATYTDFTPEEYYVKSREEMEQLSFTAEELDVTLEIAERCNVTIDLKKRRLPQYKFVPEGKTSDEHLYKLAKDGLFKILSQRNLVGTQEGNQYIERLAREMGDICDMGFADYFLIVHDVMSWCEAQGMLLGYGRGSAGGSLVSYALGITKIDPLQYNLIWERFLNKGRGGLPDIDTDVPRSQRQKVLEYIRKRFGEGNVAQLVTLGGLQAKAILKEVFKVYGMPFDEANAITALVPAKNDEHVAISLQEAIDAVPALKEYYDKYTPWFKVALALEGCYKTTGIHAAAVVISDTPFEESAYPLTRAKDGSLLFGWDMNTVDSLSLLKLDILGLTTLDDIQVTRDLVKERRGLELSRETMPLDDATTWAMIGQGFTVGIFQIEKQLGRTWSKNLQPNSIDELSDLVSLIRPGPMESNMHTAYRAVKNQGEDPKYIHDSLEPIMGRTFSALLYQEQVIEVCRQLAGMSLIDADKVRKAMGKKKPEEMRQWQAVFTDGCDKNGIDAVTASEVWGYIEKFAGYGFNKSHGVGYALLAYETAYLKANYTVEFMCAKLRHADSHPDKFEQMSALSYDAKLFEIEVVPPRVSMGNKDFAVVDDKHIAFGLTALKGVGATAITDLIKLGKSATTFDDLLWTWKTKKSKVNAGVMLALIRGGAFDDLEENRVEGQAKLRLLEELSTTETTLVDGLMIHQEQKDWLKIVRAIASEEKAPLVKEKYNVRIPDARRRPKLRLALSEYDQRELFDTKAQRIAWEQLYLGIALSGSEADIYKAQHTCIDLVKHGYADMSFEIAVCVDAVRTHTCKKGKSAGQDMAFVTARDRTHVMDNIVVFPQTFLRAKKLLETGNVLRINGRVDDRGSLVADRVERLR
jgi:DNA polymerase-3 subunit alpha